MIIQGEEIYVIDNPRDEETVMVYAPLRRFLGLAPITIKENFKNSINVTDSVVDLIMERLKSKKIISIEELLYADKKRLKININLTDNCQLRCKYCYDKSCENDTHLDMTLTEVMKVTDSFIQYYKEHSKSQRIDFSFFGGAEPTYNSKLFVESIEYIKEKCSESQLVPHFGMTTNGCYTTELMDYIINNFVGVTFSIDGPKEIHDKHRILWDGNGSFDLIINNARALHNSSIAHSYRVTVSNYSLLHWRELLDFFISEFPGDRVVLGLLLPIGRGKAIDDLIPDQDLWNKVAPQMYEYAKNKIKLSFLTVNDPDVLRVHYCGTGRGTMWIVSRDGNIVACSHDRSDSSLKVGTFDFETSTMKIDSNAVKKLKQDLAVTNLQHCKDCFCKYTCSGGCPSQNIMGLVRNCDTTRQLTALTFVDYLNE